MLLSRVRRWFHLTFLGHEVAKTRFLVPLYPANDAKTAEWCRCGRFWVR
jgi:hypothetical protein